MAITSYAANDLVLGRGKLFFDRYANGVVITTALQGEGERYIGNTPELSVTSESEDLDHFDSDAGVRTKDASVQLSLDRTGAFVTDNINSDNLALLFLGDKATLAQTAATGAISLVTGNRNRSYQLGVSPTNPSGVRRIDPATVVVKKGVAFADTVTMAGNYEIDEALGRIYVLADAPGIPDNTPLQVTFDILASTRDQVISKTQSIFGALRYIADNPKGENRDYYWPYVKLSPDGDFQLKGDDWQAIPFSIEFLKKGSLEVTYIDGRAKAVV